MQASTLLLRRMKRFKARLLSEARSVSKCKQEELEIQLSDRFKRPWGQFLEKS